MKKITLFILGILIVGFLLTAVYRKYIRGLTPVALPPVMNGFEVVENATTSTDTISGDLNSSLVVKDETGLSLTLAGGFSISIFAKGLNKPRVIKNDSWGDLWVSEIGSGSLMFLDVEKDAVAHQTRTFSNLKRPHGLAFDPADPDMLYIAEENSIFRYRIKSESKVIKRVTDLPVGGRHFSRTIGFGPDGRLYVAIGSSCDVCNEEDERRATIYSMNKDGGDFKLFAQGLRNTVFFTWNPSDNKMWGTDMGRDFLGDDLPPDEINIIEQDKNYGWPICYGNNIHDTTFDENTYIRNPCMEPFETPSHIDLPAHSAPLGLAFIPRDSKWPQEYWGDLLVAYHGSWSRTEPTGYKIVRIQLDEQGNEEGSEDFVSGWLTRSTGSGQVEPLGRPVDLLVLPEGVMYVTDDKAGVVYRITYQSS